MKNTCLENLCFSLHKYFCKNLEHEVKPNFSKYKIGPPLTIFSAFLKKNATTKSSANFLSPEPNGQGSNQCPYPLATGCIQIYKKYQEMPTYLFPFFHCVIYEWARHHHCKISGREKKFFPPCSEARQMHF